MKIKKNYLKIKSKITNERQLVIKEFLDTLNKDREGTKYPPIAPQRLGVMLGHINTYDLKIFLADCRYANHFSKYFFYKLKV